MCKIAYLFSCSTGKILGNKDRQISWHHIRGYVDFQLNLLRSIVSIIYRALYVFLVRNWHICSKFISSQTVRQLPGYAYLSYLQMHHYDSLFIEWSGPYLPVSCINCAFLIGLENWTTECMYFWCNSRNGIEFGRSTMSFDVGPFEYWALNIIDANPCFRVLSPLIWGGVLSFRT